MTSETPATEHQTGGVAYLYMAAAFVVVVAGMRAAEQVLNPLLMAIFLSIISAPAYFRLLSRGVAEWLALLTVMGVLSIILFAVVFFVTSSIAGFTSQQEYYIEKLDEKEQSLKALARSWLPSWGADEEAAAGAADSEAADQAEDVERSDEADSVTADPEGSADTGNGPGESTPAGDAVAAADDSGVSDTDAADPDASDDNDSAALAASTNAHGDSSNRDSSNADSSSADNQPADESASESTGSLTASVPPRRSPTGSSMWKMTDAPMPESEQSWTDEVFGQFDPGTLIRLATTVVQSLGLLLSKTLLVLLMVVFILLEAPRFTRKINEAFVRTEEATERASRIVKSVQHYIVIKTWVSLATGGLIAVWLHFIGISHAPLWGLLAFLFNYIPNVGSFIAAIPAVLIAWLELGFLPAFACIFGYVAVNGILGNFVEPRMMGRSLGLSPLVVFICMLFWGWVLGPVGMLLSVPLTMAASIAMDGFEDTRWLATLMGNTE